MRTKAKNLLIAMMAASPLVVPFALPAIGQMAAPSGPIDIRANEQEFAENQVIAKGNVKVTYKDSVVFAPLATLFRDAGGSPQRAVFTGHPHLTQGANKIDADTLTFEVANSKIVASGHAHSEVISEASDNTAKKPATATAGATANGAGPDSDATAATQPSSNPASATSDLSKELGGKGNTSGKAEKIITDSDLQEYDRSTGKFEATGNVRVQHGEINVKAQKLQLIYGPDSKPEAAVFTGGVNALQGKNSTSADNMTYTLATHRLQATGHVKSTVIEENKQGKKKPAVGFMKPDPLGMPSAHAATTGGDEPKEDVVIITSDSQDYSRETGRMSANGNVKVFYQDVIGAGPTAILVRNKEGKAERVVFTGRSQISQPGRRWIADRIEMAMEDKKVMATGNTKAILLQSPSQKGPKQLVPSIPGQTQSGEMIATKEKPGKKADKPL